MRRSRDIRARVEASAIGGKSRRRGRSQEDDHRLTFDRIEFGEREPNSAKIGLAVFEKRSNRWTYRQTDLSFIYTSSNARIEPIQHGSGERQVAFIGRDYSRKYLKMRLMVGEAEEV